jgi:hypothetical protein
MLLTLLASSPGMKSEFFSTSTSEAALVDSNISHYLQKEVIDLPFFREGITGVI